MEQLQFITLFTSYHVYSFIGLAISSTLFISSLLLADYSYVSKAKEAFLVYRRDAILVGPITLVMAFLTFLTMEQEAGWLYENLFDMTPWLIASGICFLLGYIALLLPQDRKFVIHFPRIAVLFVLAQYLLASYAYGRAHLPYIVYPEVTIESGFTDPNTFRALFVSYIVGFAILIPGFIYFWRMFMRDENYLRQQKETN